MTGSRTLLSRSMMEYSSELAMQMYLLLRAASNAPPGSGRSCNEALRHEFERSNRSEKVGRETYLGSGYAITRDAQDVDVPALDDAEVHRIAHSSSAGQLFLVERERNDAFDRRESCDGQRCE